MITVKIDVTLIDKTKLFPGTKRNSAGKCPQYLDIVLFENRNGVDQYGNHYVVCQSQTKEERAAKKKSVILGNAKIIGTTAKPPPKPMINQLRNAGAPAAQHDPDMPPPD